MVFLMGCMTTGLCGIWVCSRHRYFTCDQLACGGGNQPHRFVARKVGIHDWFLSERPGIANYRTLQLHVQGVGRRVVIVVFKISVTEIERLVFAEAATEKDFDVIAVIGIAGEYRLIAPSLD